MLHETHSPGAVGALRHRAVWAVLLVAVTISAPPANADGAVRVTRDITYATVDGQSLRLDLYRNRWIGLSSPRPVIVLVHGGGFVAGDKTQLRDFARTYARAGFLAVA